MVGDGEGFARQLLRSWRSGLLGVEAGGRLELVSAEALRILGQAGDPQAWLGRPAAELLADEPELRGLLGEALAGRDHPPRAELSLAGTGRTIGFTLLPVAEGRGAALFFKDLTPFERAGEQRRLSERLAALGQMAAGLAHEIRNPLAVTEVLAGLLKRKLVDAEALDLLQELLDEQRRIAAAVDACLEFVRPEPPDRAPLAVGRLLRTAGERAARRMGFLGTLVLPQGAGPEVRLDARQLERAVVDLAVNAIQAMSESATTQPHLELSVEEVPDGVVVCVADNGPGIEAPLHQQIFSPFFTTRAEGSGVGLALVQKVVTSHGGTVQLQSEPGRGSTFRLHLPEVAP